VLKSASVEERVTKLHSMAILHFVTSFQDHLES